MQSAIDSSLTDRYGHQDALDGLDEARPLDDVGKIAIPDRVLLNPGVLTGSEFELMKTHATRGARIVEDIVRNFRLGSFPFMDMLRAIVELHHEAMDGTGYPRGLKDTQIPIEARIVAVADVFDALASRRSYKEAWSNDRVFAALQALARLKLDRDCVRALEARRSELEEIQATFAERDRVDPSA
jgi:HD-GYP domain-containing protein (c-di-GMP phosphodiesterase class II)